jgi:hypothetical protein
MKGGAPAEAAYCATGLWRAPTNLKSYGAQFRLPELPTWQPNLAAEFEGKRQETLIGALPQARKMAALADAKLTKTLRLEFTIRFSLETCVLKARLFGPFIAGGNIFIRAALLIRPH